VDVYCNVKKVRSKQLDRICEVRSIVDKIGRIRYEL